MLCVSLASAVLALGSPAGPDVDATPLGAGLDAPPPAAAPWLPVHGHAPLNALPPTVAPPAAAAAPAKRPIKIKPRAPRAEGLPRTGVAPLGDGPPPVITPSEQSLDPANRDPRQQFAVRLELLVAPVWRIRTAELMSLVSVEIGRLQGFSGAVHGGVIVAPDRNIVSVLDFPVGGGFVYRHRLGRRAIHGSAGLSAGLLVHRAATDIGVVHRVDPDLQLPLRLAWTAGRVGFTFAVLQGFSGRPRTYERRGSDVWHRSAYRVGVAVGIHFDVGVRPAKSRRPASGSRR